MKLALLIPALGLAACASSGTAGQGFSGNQGNTFDLWASSGDSLTAVCNPEGCSGPTVQLQRTHEGLEGMLGQRPVHLDLGAQGVDGSVGSLPVKLTVSDQQGTLGIHGMFAGQVGDLSVGASGLQGRIGHCSYDLTPDGRGGYSGQRACQGGPVQARVRIPQSIDSRPPVERAALLAVLLAH